jgi:hypothetical protein
MYTEKQKQFYYNLAIENLPDSIIEFWKSIQTTFQISKGNFDIECVFIREKLSDIIIAIYYFEQSDWLFVYNGEIYTKENYVKIIKLKAFA